ncbi:MAG: hypothetical protein KBA33_07310 [Cloacibacterium sp.]|nr:hypothetical protein [Cloacibacterium sp.]
MMGTLRYRLSEALSVLLGKKKAVPLVDHRLPHRTIFDKEELVLTDDEKKLLENLKIEFIFSEWGEVRKNSGGAVLSNDNRLEPSLSSIRKYFPNASYTLYADFDPKIPGVDTRLVSSPFPNKTNPRFAYHTLDYHKFWGLLQSKADIAIVMDTDMFILNKEVYQIIALTQKFGICAPINSRGSVKNDSLQGIDGHLPEDLSKGGGSAYNNSPIAFYTKHEPARKYLETCAQIMLSQPSRCPLVMWKAAWENAFSPLILPPQWCLCQGQEGIGNEILLHVGHPSVSEYYKIKM